MVSEKSAASILRRDTSRVFCVSFYDVKYQEHTASNDEMERG
jgi:hypothetical protein